MPTGDDAFQKVAERLCKMCGPQYRTTTITCDTEVYADLGLYGLDLVELALWITEEFDVQGTIDIGPYGPPDVSWLPLPPAALIKLRKWLGIANPKYKSLKVRHLLKVIENRHWPSN